MNEETYQMCLSKMDTIIKNVDEMQRYIAQLQKENRDFLDTFEAIYTKLGLTEANTNGKELVSDTVKRHIDQIVDEYDFSVEEMKSSHNKYETY